MSKHIISRKAMCPHYRHEDTQMIYCDGLQEGTVIHLAFSSKTDCKAYKNAHCYQQLCNCDISRMLDERGEHINEWG